MKVEKQLFVFLLITLCTTTTVYANRNLFDHETDPSYKHLHNEEYSYTPKYFKNIPAREYGTSKNIISRSFGTIFSLIGALIDIATLPITVPLNCCIKKPFSGFYQLINEQFGNLLLTQEQIRKTHKVPSPLPMFVPTGSVTSYAGGVGTR